MSAKHRPTMPDDALASFRRYVSEWNPSQNAYPYEFYNQRPERERTQAYPVWFLQQLFNHITGPGFALG
jgi:hypothetical protein